jgi:uncharacterized NAD-dependent epimerase/dehydratase family protein
MSETASSPLKNQRMEQAQDYTGLRDHHQIVLLTDGYSTPFLAKTAISMLRYRQSDIVAVLDQQAAGKTAQALLGAGGDVSVLASLSEVSKSDAMYIGIAPPGGSLPKEWRPLILEALRRRMDVVSGLHDFLSEDAEFVQASELSGGRLIDVRRNQYKSTAKCHDFRTGCLRIHSVGQDCSIGKMVTTLEMERGLKKRGLNAKFLATGQTGIMISGEGVPVDCVVSDFVNGATEELVVKNEHHDFLLIEGQGSISHPAFSAVTLGLLHGCAPDGLVYCYEAGRKQVKGLNGIDIPPIQDQIRAYELLSNLRHPCRFIGIAVNTRYLTDELAAAEIEWAESTLGLPACDVYRTGAEKLVEASIQLRNEIGSRCV